MASHTNRRFVLAIGPMGRLILRKFYEFRRAMALKTLKPAYSVKGKSKPKSKLKSKTKSKSKISKLYAIFLLIFYCSLFMPFLSPFILFTILYALSPGLPAVGLTRRSRHSFAHCVLSRALRSTLYAFFARYAFIFRFAWHLCIASCVLRKAPKILRPTLGH